MASVPTIDGKLVVGNYSAHVSKSATEGHLRALFLDAVWEEQAWFGHGEPPVLVPIGADMVTVARFKEYCIDEYTSGNYDGQMCIHNGVGYETCYESPECLSIVCPEDHDYLYCDSDELEEAIED